MHGLYVHVPFCVRKCLYCDFYSVADLTRMDAYTEAVVREIALSAPAPGSDLHAVDTVYFGGGTPSVLPAAHLGRIMDAIDRHYGVQSNSEITLEANPGTVDLSALGAYRALGINRLSIGIQSFRPDHLSLLGRIHTAGESRALIRAAHNAGFDDLGLDLIYGLPGQTLDMWRQDLAEALSFNPSHLSCYTLTWEPGTPLFARMVQGLVTPLDEDKAAALFEETLDVLDRQGFVHYEISNFARSRATRSRHNMKYWDFEPYTGFGPSAHSYTPSGHRRSWNVRDLSAYIEELKNGRLPVEDREILDRGQQMTEALFLGFRKMDGIVLSDFNRRFGCDFVALFQAPLAALTREGLVALSTDRAFLTRKGILLADSITSLFVEALE